MLLVASPPATRRSTYCRWFSSGQAAGGAQAWPWPRRPSAVWLPLGSRLCLAAPSPASQRQRCRCCCRCPAAAATCGSSHTVPPTVGAPTTQALHHALCPLHEPPVPALAPQVHALCWPPRLGLFRRFSISDLSATMCFWGGCEAEGQKFGVGRSTRQRTTALLGRVGSRVRLFSVFFLVSSPPRRLRAFSPKSRAAPPRASPEPAARAQDAHMYSLQLFCIPQRRAARA